MLIWFGIPVSVEKLTSIGRLSFLAHLNIFQNFITGSMKIEIGILIVLTDRK